MLGMMPAGCREPQPGTSEAQNMTEGPAGNSPVGIGCGSVLRAATGLCSDVG